jgi:RNA polymerase sigma factor (sigma-70 family)
VFFARYDPLVEFLTAVYLRRPEDRLDCRQVVWLHILRKLPDFQLNQQRGQFRCWLFILIRNRVLDFARHLVREHQHECALPGNLPARAVPPPWWICIQHECQCCLHESLDELERHVSPLNRRLLHLRYRRQLTVREAAGRLHLTPRQVTGRLVRLRRRLLHDVRRRANGQSPR